jgi:hypothetical protein
MESVSMNKRVLAIAPALLAPGVASYLLAAHLLNEWWLYAVVLYGLCFSGGLWLLPISPSAVAHALSVGTGIGLVAAMAVFMASASAT